MKIKSEHRVCLNLLLRGLKQETRLLPLMHQRVLRVAGLAEREGALEDKAATTCCKERYLCRFYAFFFFFN